jgi:hypothetical protein
LTSLTLILAAAFPALADEAVSPSAPDGAATAKVETPAKDAEKSEQKAKNDDHYFIVVEGKGMPVREILVNGVNVLGGSVISLSMPINVTPQIKLGLNEIKVRYVSHDDEALVTIMEKRTAGPKRVEVVKMFLPPKHSQGKEMVKDLAFDVDPAPTPPAKIEISQADQDEILGLTEQYYKALNTKNATKLRALYSAALKEEQKIFPEGAEFFSKVLTKEIALMKRKDIKMGGFSSADLMLEQEGSKIKALRKDRQPMMESNEIEIEVDPIFSEVKTVPGKGGSKNKKGKKESQEEPQRTTAKQRLLTTTLLFKRIDGQWHLALPRGV